MWCRNSRVFTCPRAISTAHVSSVASKNSCRSRLLAITPTEKRCLCPQALPHKHQKPLQNRRWWWWGCCALPHTPKNSHNTHPHDMCGEHLPAVKEPTCYTLPPPPHPPKKNGFYAETMGVCTVGGDADGDSVLPVPVPSPLPRCLQWPLGTAAGLGSCTAQGAQRPGSETPAGQRADSRLCSVSHWQPALVGQTRMQRFQAQRLVAPTPNPSCCCVSLPTCYARRLSSTAAVAVSSRHAIVNRQHRHPLLQ